MRRGSKRAQTLSEFNEQNFEGLLKVFNGTVEAIAALYEKRDPYTAGHQRRVAQLACAIARKMGLPEEQIYGIHIIGVVHDIGKIAVPGDILSKPGRLSPEEFNIVKTHPQVAYEVLRNLEFPWPVAETILQHHERLDGSGYPNGISGKAIILEARILCVADVVESMASHRPYRPALGKKKALNEILKYKGILYDPAVADACSRLSSNGGFNLDCE
ncbi:MAG: HD-GYP domain-containing protein [Chloroflexi bacterium]|nr:HD-GYP domain-containing protein [Chloroflexota bacterium]